jgi:hypothetical protein
MKRLVPILGLVLILGLPVLAQQMSPDDQGKFNDYYSRWTQDKQRNDRDDMINMEQRMQDLMSRYQIPSNTPYEVVAAQSGYSGANPYSGRYDRDRGYAGGWQGRLSPDDQREFNEQYHKWQKGMSNNDRGEIDEHARNMQKIMARYNIPPDTPFDVIASTNGYSGHYDYGQFRGRLSPEDQSKFDNEYQHWLKDRAKNDRDDIAKHEGKMQEIMAKYNIPRDVPYDAIASGGRY